MAQWAEGNLQKYTYGQDEDSMNLQISARIYRWTLRCSTADEKVAIKHDT